MTLEEIAKEIGVSKSTVSRALSGKGRIGETTRNRILEVAKRGEEREEMARTRTVTHNIGVVLPSDVYYGSGVYFQNCLLGVCESASMLGYNVLIRRATRMIFQSCSRWWSRTGWMVCS